MRGRIVLAGLMLSASLAAVPMFAQEKSVVLKSTSELPAYSHRLEVAPSELMTGDLDRLLQLADAVIANDRITLARFEIADRTTLEAFIRHRLHAAMLRGDLQGVRVAAEEFRAIQSRADKKLGEGLAEEIAVEACATSSPADTAFRLATERFSALPFDQVDDWVKSKYAQFASANPALILGRARSDLDPAAEKAGGMIDQSAAAQIVEGRVAIDCTSKVSTQLAKALHNLIREHGTDRPHDIWAARDVVLSPEWNAKPTGVAIWDSGVDLALFETTEDRGLAIDGNGRPVTALLRDTENYKQQIPTLYKLLKGMMDLSAGLSTSDAEAYQQHVAGLSPADVKGFSESLGFIANYVHGTHVAGIVVAGNPFVRIQAVSMHFPFRQEEIRLDRSISEQRSVFYGEAVARMKRSGVRVANMSWRLSPAFFEAALAAQGGYPDAGERKKVAGELFAMEKKALLNAILSAPEILFVAGSGNEGNDGGFADYIPAGLSAPNLITVGAVDRSGREALFTSVGGAVAIYANGVEVDSLVPGGERLAISGTSMASPQVANAAAKLLAMKPSLSGAEVREILLGAADTQGRVKLLNLKAAFADANVVLPE